MNHVHIKPNNTVNKIRTTIGVKLWTKRFILNHSNPGESLDDTIVRVFNAYDRQLEEISRLKTILEDNGVVELNLVLETSEERTDDVLTTEDGTNIFFSYIKPILKFPEVDTYTMQVMITGIKRKGRKIDPAKVGYSDDDWIWIRFKIIEKIINNHFDPSYQIPAKTMIIDPHYWRTVCARVGLSNTTLENDILRLIRDYERSGGLDGQNTPDLYGSA